MLRFVNMLELLLVLVLVLVLVEGCGGVSENDDEDSGDNGDTIPPPETGPFPPLDAVVEVSNGFLRGVRIVVDGVMHYQAIP